MKKKVMDVISLEKADVLLLISGIILVKLVPNCSVKKRDLVKFLSSATKLSAGKNYAIILDGNRTMEVEDEAMLYVSSFRDSRWKALAIVVRVPSGRLYADYFIKFAGTSRPIKSFDSLRKASAWLQEIT